MKAIKYVVLIVTIIFLSIITLRMDFSGVKNAKWISWLILLMALAFIKEAKKSWNGNDSLWNFLTERDKVIFTICTIILLLFCLYPIKEEVHMGVTFLMFSVGIALTAAIENKFGSDTLKEFLWWS